MRLPKTLILIVTIFFLTALAAAAEEDRLVSTGVAPAAEGKVVTNVDRNGNIEVEVQVKHLASADKLTPAKQTYFVWVQGRGKDPEPLGTLRVNENLEGSVKATTPYKTFDLFVTAEDNMKPATPSSMVVLRGSVDRK